MENKEIRRLRLLELLKSHGTLAAIGEKTETPANYLSTVKNREREMGDKVARRIEEKLGLPKGWMDRMDDQEAEQVPRVPVVGTAQLGDDGYWEETGHPTGHGEGFVRYPSKDKNAYALRVKGDSMRPRIKPGEFVVVEPSHAIVPGDEVLVKTKDGRCMVKVLGFHRNGALELLSINEDHRPITLDREKVELLHYVAAIMKPAMYYDLHAQED